MNRGGGEDERDVSSGGGGRSCSCSGSDGAELYKQSRSSTQSEPRHVTQFQELEECFDTKKITLEKYVQGMSTHTNYCYCCFIYLIVHLYCFLFKSRRNATFWSEVGEKRVG